MEKILILLQETNDLSKKISLIISLIEEEIQKILLDVKRCDDINEATRYFDLLEQINNQLCDLYYNKNVSISNRLKKFVNDCDRLDDPWLRDYLFKKIKNNEYSLFG